MQNFITIFFCLTSVILLIILIIKKDKINTINQNIELENKKLEKDKEIIINEIKTLNQTKAEKNKTLQELEQMIVNMDNSAKEAFNKYCDLLNTEYNIKENEYDEAIIELINNYNKIQDKLITETAQIKKDLEKISSTRSATLQAQLKEQEIKNKRAFYCPQIPINELKDAKILKDIEYKLNNPRVLRMLIWQTYYQKPINQVCANVLGGATAEVCGIYKITNQLNDLTYIGQAVDIATRWKNHAKAGLGIDTPANNKLYKAMIEDGLENFSFELLEQCNRNELNEKEK